MIYTTFDFRYLHVSFANIWFLKGGLCIRCLSRCGNVKIRRHIGRNRLISHVHRWSFLRNLKSFVTFSSAAGNKCTKSPIRIVMFNGTWHELLDASPHSWHVVQRMCCSVARLTHAINYSRALDLNVINVIASAPGDDAIEKRQRTTFENWNNVRCVTLQCNNSHTH